MVQGTWNERPHAELSGEYLNFFFLSKPFEVVVFVGGVQIVKIDYSSEMVLKNYALLMSVSS